MKRRTSSKMNEKSFYSKVVEGFERVDLDELKGPFYVCGMGVMKKLIKNASISN